MERTLEPPGGALGTQALPEGGGLYIVAARSRDSA